MPTTIARAEAFEAEWRLERKNTDTGALEPLPADTAVRWWLSATFKGDPIIVSSVVILTRRGLELRTDSRALWYGVLASDDVTAALVGIVTGGAAFEVCEVDGERKSAELVVAD